MCKDNDASGRRRGPLSILQSRKDSGWACYVENTLDPPYKRPELLVPGNSSIVHCCLQPLKVAHACLVKLLSAKPGVPPRKYPSMNAIYRAHIEYGADEDELSLGRMWLHDRLPWPMTIEGFALVDQSHKRSAFSFDFSFFSFSEKSDYPTGTSRKLFLPAITAAQLYNEYVTLLYHAGFVFFPAFFADALAALYPVHPLPEGVPLYRI